MICRLCNCFLRRSDTVPGGYDLADANEAMERWLNDPFTVAMPCLINHQIYDPRDAAREIIEAMRTSAARSTRT
jgi:hypothetical protein